MLGPEGIVRRQSQVAWVSAWVVVVGGGAPSGGKVLREGVEMQRSGFPNIEACLSYNGGLKLATENVVPAHGHMHMVTDTWSEGLCTGNFSKAMWMFCYD